MKNIDELITQTVKAVAEVYSGDLKPTVATEVFNGVGKTINLLKLKLDYANTKARVKGLKIDFMEDGK